MATANLSSALSSFSLVHCSEVDLQILVGCGVLDLAGAHGNHVTVHFVVGREGLHYGIGMVCKDGADPHRLGEDVVDCR
ncbi:hypothetical protein L484_005706 [Morus notabilis]|uniref:Uncharacterized protein n=1 Tax=Morus notabilis TaxID=981085 RepID=W9QHR5_9ROSA|nr:hypothetical protein L484_005706 [Morus notabilis]